ncbi:S8 family peptidase [Streptomyces himalayensis]|uniref:S8 family serine peptidase n=1 Tax=Streptomyces himalayensis subsp. himalayensis TaxID=2756131 RepID=A0A7W0DU48_9ACTN|nr:S8 family serine peptidase [Streptomyces himalayensis]MBA2950499.1 S8 family serine peptidase [Streptomyces himalayensis subsp. himalayensis]
MRATPRTAVTAAITAVLAVTAVAPSGAQPRDGAADGTRPLVGSPAAAQGDGTRQATVTLVTGDRVVVRTDKDGRSTATVLPHEDGTQPLVQTRQSGKDLYVYPESAIPAIASGKADEQLFNVTGLVRQGYDDAHTDQLPLIATYDTSVDVAESAPAAPRGSERKRVLDAVDGVALKADKKKAADFWADVTNSRSRAAGDLKKLWLDAKVEATLDRSTKQVGAPEAWAAGYDGTGTTVAVLDTGADADHPDLKDRIAESRNFTDSDTADDRDGHGTHTISTVGGSGAASDGKKKGVAPGTRLLAGKVLNDYGYGETSWIIAGMQWAVDQKADVVSMSLGSPEPTDCTDPMSIAAEELAGTSDTLFVVAAGNSGPALNRVSSPGCTPGVLTVGAVDRDDSTASFSSPGPAPHTHTLKPEIAAPGVGISAAAAGGRGVYAYQSMSGTSMATPHVAGAAAILKQRHPDWSPQELKAALVSSAHSGIPGDVRETGGGRLDVKAAIGQTVLGSPAVQGGTFDWPGTSSDRTTVEVPYTNTSDNPVTLDLSVTGVTGNDGTKVHATVAKLGQRSVTVPAGETVKVPLTLDPSAHLERSQYGDVTGRVIAEADGVTVSTPFSLYVQPETVTLRVKLVDRLGEPASGLSSLDVIGTDDASGERRFNEGAADQTYELRPGSYFLSAFVATTDNGGDLVNSLAYLARPEFELTKDTTVVLDARVAHRLTVETDRPTEDRNTTLAFARSWDDTWLHGGSMSGNRQVKGYYASVEGRAHDGDFEFGSYWRRYAPQIESFGIEGGPQLHPVTASTGSDNLDGSGSAEVVDAGSGTAAELAAANVKGKIALIKVADDETYLYQQAQDAKNAGAVAVVAHHASADRWYPSVGWTNGPLPVLALPADEAGELLDRLASGPVTVKWQATAASPYVYNLAFPEDAPLASDRAYKVGDTKLGRNETTYHAMGVAADYLDAVTAYRPNADVYLTGLFDLVAAPGKRTEYYTAGDTSFSQWVSSSFPYGESMLNAQHAYEAGERRTESWYGGVLAPTAPLDDAGEQELAAERQGDLIGIAPAFWGDSEHAGLQGSFGDIGSIQLRIDGEEQESSPVPWGVWKVPAEDAAYELTLTTMKFGIPGRVWKRSTMTQTTWEFRSKLDESVYSQGLPILFPQYRLPEDGMKTLAAEDDQKLTLGVTGHAGYTPEALESAQLSYSYDDGQTWTEAKTAVEDGTWTATVHHAGASGKPVTLKSELTDANGNSVTQTVTRAYDVR